MESCLASSQRIVIGVAEAAVSANPGACALKPECLAVISRQVFEA